MKMNTFVKSVIAEAASRCFGDLNDVVIEGIEARYSKIYDAVISAGYGDYTFIQFIRYLTTNPKARKNAIQKYFLSIIPNGDLNYILFDN